MTFLAKKLGKIDSAEKCNITEYKPVKYINKSY